MEGDDIEMSEMELQEWIKEEVNKSQLFSPDVLEKCNILQSHLERRDKRAARLLKLCESVAACEAIVHKQYSLLGWEYTDTHSEVEGDKVTNCGSSPQPVCGSVQCDTQDRHSSATSKLRYSERLNDNYRKMCSNVLKRKPVVVLTRLPAFKIRSLYPSTAEQHSCENEPLSSLDFDVSDSTPNSNTENASNAMKTRTSRENLTSDAKDSRKPSPPAANTNSNVNNSGSKTLMPGATRSDNATTKTTNGEDVKVDMMVLARKKHMKWQQGKIMELLRKEDGRLKYKISFDEKGKSLVSGHHIAFEHTPKLEQLYVGARVVARCKENKFKFCPGILAELPNRKNRLRFLVFMDDHTPMYVGLPSLHLVCRPLEDSLEDLPDGPHKSFMKQYLKDWPYPHLTQYKPGQTFNVERNGVLQMCEVQVVDSSLIQVTFQDTQQKEWIHRGSIRLEHMTRFLEERRSQNKNDCESE